MTKEQKEKALAFLKDMQECTYDGVEEIRTAIECLEQPTSDDCVSRQAVLDKKVLIELPDGQSFYSIDPEDVKNMPPVTPAHCIAAVRFSKDDLREICNERIEIECTHGTCKDCRWLTTDEDGNYYCKQTGYFDRLDFYCADFEKRGSENGKK